MGSDQAARRVRRYAYVNATCLHHSPTSLWHKAYLGSGGLNTDLIAHTEAAAAYDGLAVKWGPLNKQPSVEACLEDCKQHVPDPSGGGAVQSNICRGFCARQIGSN